LAEAVRLLKDSGPHESLKPLPEKRREAQSRDGELKQSLHLEGKLTEITEGGGQGLRLRFRNDGADPVELTVADEVTFTIVTPGEEGERVSTHVRTFRREPGERNLALSPGEGGTVLRYSGNDGPKIGSDSTVRARCWVNSIDSAKVRDSVVLTAENR